MGASNVKAAYASWGRLPHQAFRVLAFMALTARDDGTPPRYWGGHDTLATAALGRGLAGPLTASDLRSVRRAVAELVNAGAVILDAPSSPRSNASYRLNLLPTQDLQRPTNSGQSASGERRTLSAASADAQRPEHRTLSDRTQDAQRPTEEQKEPEGLTSGHTTYSSAQPQGDARTECACGHERFTGEGECVRCGRPREAA